MKRPELTVVRMEDNMASNGELPEIGEDFVVEVVAAPTRTSYFPDQCAVFTRGPNVVEIVLLRQEVALKSQTGTVVTRDGQAVQVQFRPNVIQPEMLDIAHVRMDMEAALDTAYGIITHALVHGMQREDALNRLRDLNVQSI